MTIRLGESPLSEERRWGHPLLDEAPDAEFIAEYVLSGKPCVAALQVSRAYLLAQEDPAGYLAERFREAYEAHLHIAAGGGAPSPLKVDESAPTSLL